MSYEPKDPKPATVTANREAVGWYDMDDEQDFTDLDRGLIARLPGPVVNAGREVTFDTERFDLLRTQKSAPDTVNPSLWRQARAITTAGLYKVVDGLYQVRNNDTGNLTIVEGPDGLVIIDCQTAIEPRPKSWPAVTRS